MKQGFVLGEVINMPEGINFMLENFALSVLFGETDTHRKDKKSKAFYNKFISGLDNIPCDITRGQSLNENREKAGCVLWPT